MRRHHIAAVVALLLVVRGGPAHAQELRQAVDRTRQAWLSHDAEQMLAGSDTVTLLLPGRGPAVAWIPGQAARVLSAHLAQAREREFSVTDVRQVGNDRAYAEARRRYVVAGTSDLLEDTVMLGFVRRAGGWRVSEVRIGR